MEFTLSERGATMKYSYTVTVEGKTTCCRHRMTPKKTWSMKGGKPKFDEDTRQCDENFNENIWNNMRCCGAPRGVAEPVVTLLPMGGG